MPSRVHNEEESENAGHPNNQDFARILKLGNARPEVVRWVKHHFKCDDCEADRRPKARRPTAVPRTYRFNHVVGIDLVDVRNPDGVKQHWLNYFEGFAVCANCM